MHDKEWIGGLPDGESRYWMIVYPVRDRTKLAVVEMCDGTDYEEKDYDIASRKRFRVQREAIVYCRGLALQHGLKFDSDSHDELLLD